MSSNVKLSLAAAEAQANAIAPLCNGGFIDFYSTAQPSTPETPPGGTSLATLDLPNPAAASVTNGLMTFNAIPGGTVAVSGTALWFRITENDHSTPVLDGTVGTSGSDINLNSTTLVNGTSLNLSALTIQVPGS